jgi:hypothetical protein
VNWEAIGALGEVLGAVAVIASLAYLAVQIKANTTSIEVASRQSVSNEFREFNRFLVEDPEIFPRGLAEYPNMEFNARSKFGITMHDLLLFFQSTFAVYESGSLEEETHQTYISFVAGVISTPGGAEFWREWKVAYTPKMVQALDERVKEGNLVNLLDFRNLNFHWKLSDESEAHT